MRSISGQQNSHLRLKPTDFKVPCLANVPFPKNQYQNMLHVWYQTYGMLQLLESHLVPFWNATRPRLAETTHRIVQDTIQGVAATLAARTWQLANSMHRGEGPSPSQTPVSLYILGLIARHYRTALVNHGMTVDEARRTWTNHLLIGLSDLMRFRGPQNRIK